MPLADPVYQIKVNPNDGFRRSWDPQGTFGGLFVEKAALVVDGKTEFLDKALQLTAGGPAVNSRDIQYISDAVVTNPTIASVNSNLDVTIAAYNSTRLVTIAGTDFGATQGTVTYNGQSLVINSWADDTVRVEWPAIPFNASFSGTRIGVQYNVVLTRADAESDSRGAISIAATGEYFATITSIPTNSIYADDTDVVVGDEAYIRVVAGSVDTVNAATGVLDGVSEGTQVEYAIWDTSAGAWVN